MADLPDRVRSVMQAVSNVHVLATVDSEGKPRMRWMGALYEDPKAPWTFYLVCGKDSRKMHQISANNHAQMLFSKQDDWQVATLSGTATVVDTAELRSLLWKGIPMMDKYYSGPDDPNMGIIQFKTRCMELLALDEQHEPYCFELE
ncbi:MAG: pyridoxamine 5'-phosphate oxidase family protein [Armatimonadia bacterium]